MLAAVRGVTAAGKAVLGAVVYYTMALVYYTTTCSGLHYRL